MSLKPNFIAFVDEYFFTLSNDLFLIWMLIDRHSESSVSNLRADFFFFLGTDVCIYVPLTHYLFEKTFVFMNEQVFDLTITFPGRRLSGDDLRGIFATKAP